MIDPDLNLLTALDVMLTQGSVAGAARVLGLSTSAMSRTLSRLRDTTGDPLLVRAGRGLVPTPHAVALRERVHGLAGEVKAVLQPATRAIDLATLERVFTIRANEGFVEAHAARLVGTVTKAAPGVQLRFAPKPDKDVRLLREGLVDLDIGVLGETGPEVKIQSLFRDHFVGVVCRGHPLLKGEMTAARYAACGHVVASRRGRTHGPVDDALMAIGLRRRIVVVVPGFPAAMAVASASNLVGLVTKSFVLAEQTRRGGKAGKPMQSFDLPVRTEPITVSQMWHPRADSDPAHCWLRSIVLATCRPRMESIEKPGAPAV
ncbi:LysR family transcriptional regulator [Lichenifustis flavocetrariae]|uniref:LysR family transcriptional regulator n=1 Tax=Lichenifustis flavocetrariae TaxID=2949735 RepID=A0AA41YX81_9HYPH|nr:LysR family transcriptional regulator [Lichenifustis flavocetrariae]MCW6506608.1 LysR family transcriptional regulator [Lichenifustis flavocetrariae]